MLSRTSTVPSRLITAYTREPYAHTSIALDLQLNEMYSFARKRIHNPIDCGFIYEDIETGVFGRDKGTICSVYALPVTEEQYKNVIKEIDVFKQFQPEYSYNFTGIVCVMVNKPIVRNNKYFCSEFVAYVLDRSGIKLFNKHNSLVSPSDFRLLLDDRKIFDGLLINYRKHVSKFTEEEIEEVLACKTHETNAAV